MAVVVAGGDPVGDPAIGLETRVPGDSWTLGGGLGDRIGFGLLE
jgi:hypothetical protein